MFVWMFLQYKNSVYIYTQFKEFKNIYIGGWHIFPNNYVLNFQTGDAYCEKLFQNEFWELGHFIITFCAYFWERVQNNEWKHFLIGCIFSTCVKLNWHSSCDLPFRQQKRLFVKHNWNVILLTEYDINIKKKSMRSKKKRQFKSFKIQHNLYTVWHRLTRS